ncbi:MAG: phosphohistidine phosphatase SixA [Elusimicrobiota bacterium]
MKLYLMRHGDSPGMLQVGVKRDFDRPLSDAGREAARRTAAHLNEKGVRPALILVSPLVRAQQTAEEVAGVLKPAPELRVYEPLSNKIDGASMYARIGEDGLRDGELLLIGHLPQLPELAHHLTGQDIPLRPAELCAFEVSGDSGRLLWAVSPSDS